MKNNIIYILAALLLSSCSVTKNIPDGDQLFTGLTKIDYANYEKGAHFDSTQEEVEAALATAPNGALFGSSYYRTPFPYGLWIWNALSGSNGKVSQWVLKSFGKQPVLMSWVNPALRASVAQSVLRNHGYFQGRVGYEAVKQKNPKKSKIGYTVSLGPLYTVDTVHYVNFPPAADSLIKATLPDAAIHSGDAFDVASLDAERSRITRLFRNNGYYYYQPGYASYLADTFDVQGKARLRFQLADGIPAGATRKWHVGRINISLLKSMMEQPSDSLARRYFTVRFSGKKPPLRPRVILSDLKLRRGQLYSYDNYLASANNLNSMGLFSMVDFNFTPRDTTAHCDTLDLNLNCVLDRPYDFYIETNFNNRTIGRMGPELKMGLVKRNAFRGGEKIDLNLHGSYEWQTSTANSDMNNYEYGADLSVEFPRIIAPFFNRLRPRRSSDGRRRRPLFFATPVTLAKASTNIIYRPGYYKMHVVSGEWTYRWQSSVSSRHEFSPLTVKYQFMNSHTDKFLDVVVNNPYLLATMSDYFIPQMRYTYTYVSPKKYLNPIRWETTVAESGNITSLGYMVAGKKWSDKDKTLFKNAYSQFVKIETDFTKTWRLDNSTQLVGHVNAGWIYTFGNSDTTPYSEMYYVGGANSVRAFAVRSVGPGRFPGIAGDRQISYLVQNGNVKLVANLEYRKRLFGSVYGALFLDAGNVWTNSGSDDLSMLSDSEAYTGFKLNKLYDDLAIGTGIGLRYDLDFLVLRLDWGVGLHLPYDTGHSGFYNVGKFKDSHTLHFAIGYPF